MVKLSLTRPQAELWFIGAMIRELPTDFALDTANLTKAKAEHVGAVQPEHFREPLLRSAWLAAVDEYAETGNATAEGVCGRIAALVPPEMIRELFALLLYARNYAEGLRSNGRWYAKAMAENLIEKSHAG